MSGIKFILKPWFGKICLLFLAVFLTGLPQSCWQAYETVKVETPTKMLSQKEISEMRIILRSYMEEKVAIAKHRISQGGSYTFADYFGYRKDYVMKVRSLKLESYFSEDEGSGVSELKVLITQNLRNKKDHTEMVAAREDYEKNCDPRYWVKKKAEADLKASGWHGVLAWFFFLYLKIMLPILGLLVIWRFEDQKAKKTLLIPNPLHFLLMLIAYPITIGNIFLEWKNCKGREWRTEAELRRTRENLFSYLSESEVQRIKAFAKSAVPMASWRQQLSDLGLKPQRGLALALIVTLLISIVPNLAQAETKAKTKSFLPENAWEQVVDQGQHLARMSIADDDQSQNSIGQQDGEDIFVEFSNLEIFFIEKQIEIQEILLRLKEVYFHIDHIPLFGYSV